MNNAHKKTSELNEVELCKLLKNYIEISLKESEKVIFGNKQAGVRVRKNMQHIRSLSVLIREKIQVRAGKKSNTKTELDIKNADCLSLNLTQNEPEYPGDNIIYMDSVESRLIVSNRLNSFLQHKLRVLMRCRSIFNFVIKNNQSFTFQKNHTIRKKVFDDPKTYEGNFQLYHYKENSEKVIVRIIITKY